MLEFYFQKIGIYFSMGYINDFTEQVNRKLLLDGISINMPEHKFKKVSDRFNEVLREVYEDNRHKKIEMHHILISLSDYFDMVWLKENVLDEKNIELIQSEMEREFNVKRKKRK